MQKLLLLWTDSRRKWTFINPLKRMNLTTFAHLKKSQKVKTSTNKLIDFRQQSNIAFHFLVMSQKFDLMELLKYPLSPVPFSLGIADGFLAKNDKSKGYHYLTDDVDDFPLPPAKETLFIMDGNAMFYQMKEVPKDFKEISLKVFKHLPTESDVVFSTDMYVPNSNKDNERMRRGCGEKLFIHGENTKRPADWKVFLTNSENKQQYIQVLSNVWGSNEMAKMLTET